MRLFGHPIHVMLVHFPIALWPAHAAVHAFSSHLPDGSELVAFWLLVAATALAWLAMICGAVDLMSLALAPGRPSFRLGLIHAAINGTVTIAFTLLLAMENAAYPNIHHGHGVLLVELGLLILMFVGNFFGGAIVWSMQPESRSKVP
jgi:uncharacterized membrane protein